MGSARKGSNPFGVVYAYGAHITHDYASHCPANTRTVQWAHTVRHLALPLRHGALESQHRESRNANRAQGGGDVLCQLWLKSDRFKNHVTQGWGLLQPSHGLAWQKICHPGYLFLGARARVTSVPCGVSLALAMWLEIIRTYRGNMYIYY